MLLELFQFSQISGLNGISIQNKYAGQKRFSSMNAPHSVIIMGPKSFLVFIQSRTLSIDSPVCIEAKSEEVRARLIRFDSVLSAWFGSFGEVLSVGLDAAKGMREGCATGRSTYDGWLPSELFRKQC